jgi:hypothetical protein
MEPVSSKKFGKIISHGCEWAFPFAAGTPLDMDKPNLFVLGC